ncbi:MAG: hypothetical protein Kow00117_08040 [Phototrophicales bacterium]
MTLKRWRLDGASPYALQLAADARLARTDYLDDQIWELLPGMAESSALTLQTSYGGRVTEAMIVPMWWHDGHSIHQSRAYAVPPVITFFAPGYAQAEGKITPTLPFTAEYWVMESHAIGGRYTIQNISDIDQTLRLDLVGYVGADHKDQPVAIMSLADGTNALSLGKLARILNKQVMPNWLEPVIVLENAKAEIPLRGKAAPQIGTTLNIPANGQVAIRWVHAGLSRMQASLERTRFWLAQDWDKAIQTILEAAQAIPIIETGDDDQDVAIAFSYHHLLQSFMRPTEHLPYASFVATRLPEKGFSRTGDGKDYDRGWNGQNPQVAYLAALGVASISGELAQGVVQNYLAVQSPEGDIDLKPGLGGQRQGILCTPVLARLAWHIYQYTEDRAFLQQVYPGLLNFYNRWSEHDVDVDGDVMPEWQDERQLGYVFFPTFGNRESWAQNADIRKLETPDMAAYMLSETLCLSNIAKEIQDPGSYELYNRLTSLQRFMEKLWYHDRYAYQERDTDITAPRVDILVDVPCDEEHLPAKQLQPATRLIIRVNGGAGRVPRASLFLQGVDRHGNEVSETVPLEQFMWGYGGGTYTSMHIYQQVDRIYFEGLSRVYKLTVHTLDTTRLDINALMPLMLNALPENRLEPLVKLLQDEAHFWRKSGVSIVSAQDPNYDPSSARGGGGVWAYWLTLIGEGLIDAGRGEIAAQMLKRLIKTQTHSLKHQKAFREFYHADEPIGLGEKGHLSGVVPVYLLMRTIGVQIVDRYRVYTGGAFYWGSPVTVTQHGVVVTRTQTSTTIKFPSGKQVTLNADAERQLVQDDAAPLPVVPLPTIMPPVETPTSKIKRVVIEVQQNTDE